MPDSIERADAVSDAFDGNPTTVATMDGDVAITSIAADNDGQVGWVDVMVEDCESGDPHFRVVNPPLYAEDPAGDVEINGRRFRYDPVAAVAESIGMNGGRRRR